MSLGDSIFSKDKFVVNLAPINTYKLVQSKITVVILIIMCAYFQLVIRLDEKVYLVIKSYFSRLRLKYFSVSMDFAGNYSYN